MVKKVIALIFFSYILTACRMQNQQTSIHITILADGMIHEVKLPAKSTVKQAIAEAGIELAPEDRIIPPLYSQVLEGTQISIVRLREEFETQQVIIPFERQELRNESLPSGEIRLVQSGQNGLRKITIRHVFENNIETSSSVVSEDILQAPLPEIIMIGVQSPFTPMSIPGKLVYIKGSSAWIMEGSTSNPRPLVTTGDLDGHIFSLSPDGKWLLYSRKSTLPSDQKTNSLWLVNTIDQSPEHIDLGISNVVNFADWQPGKEYIIAYSTVQPISTPPG